MLSNYFFVLFRQHAMVSLLTCHGNLTKTKRYFTKALFCFTKTAFRSTKTKNLDYRRKLKTRKTKKGCNALHPSIYLVLNYKTTIYLFVVTLRIKLLIFCKTKGEMVCSML